MLVYLAGIIRRFVLVVLFITDEYSREDSLYTVKRISQTCRRIRVNVARSHTGSEFRAKARWCDSDILIYNYWEYRVWVRSLTNADLIFLPLFWGILFCTMFCDVTHEGWVWGFVGMLFALFFCKCIVLWSKWLKRWLLIRSKHFHRLESLLFGYWCRPPVLK